MGKQINLTGNTDITIITREEMVLSTDKISVDELYDDGKMVRARISFFSSTGMSKELILWEGQDYIDIDQWTDTDVENRIKELLNII